MQKIVYLYHNTNEAASKYKMTEKATVNRKTLMMRIDAEDLRALEILAHHQSQPGKPKTRQQAARELLAKAIATEKELNPAVFN
jgi:hypothetical protein